MNEKIILVGDGGVGKTTFVNKLQTGQFTSKYKYTVGFEVKYVDNMEIWDCAGQEKYSGLRDGYWINAKKAIIMFSMDNRLTFKNVPYWYRDVRRVCGDIPIIIMGNKSDSQSEVQKEEVEALATKYNVEYLITSVKYETVSF